MKALRTAGYERVVVARMQPDDVGEDAAARRVAAALIGPGLSMRAASTGRVNLTASCDGLFRVDVARVDALNAVDEAIAVATLPDEAAVSRGEIAATVKIIPFALSATSLRCGEAACAGDVMTVRAWQSRLVGLTLTETPGSKPSVAAGTLAATAARVESVRGTMLPVLHCPHRTGSIAEALRRLLAAGADLLLVAGAAAAMDRQDAGPAAIVAIDGEIVR